tara:strand:- start:425 stop:592 length:168 start_codon:yes stop_codon:yes gene_type:complete
MQNFFLRRIDVLMSRSKNSEPKKMTGARIFGFTWKVTGTNSRRPGGGDALDAGLG